ncbi:peptidyl-prolyl cis-trans isomerase D [Methylomarinovum caldicuralii]|uniref:Periplasmic chaperone PpiD n=1 Tax=Methylomarinovum caldicuralii TaxID=438856 RepID=A0AAU9CH47_9GAMM|nr:SurA N-terminal domain-containing protein [Methylomarinovum caldicuralii]BCX82310.1 peptidyl-prolyl cis-trans isomerase D [Methylomarinovum caldicuralii]
MLQTIRDRAQGIFTWIILILIIVPFALWGIQNYFDTGREKPIAVVGDREFFERDLLRLYENQYARFADQYPEEELKKQALERLIDDEVLFQAAVEKKLAVSDAQVAQFIRNLPFFQTDGRFDEEKYQRLLAGQGLTTTAFVAQVRRTLLMEQLRRSITDSAFATEAEAKRFYQLQNQQRKIAYLILPLPEEGIEVGDAEIQAYYNAHRDQFQTPEKVAVEYVKLSIDDIARTIQPTEDELRQYYEEQQQAFTTPEERRIRHILIAVKQDASPEEKQQALEKAKAVRQRLLQGEDFVHVAKEVSDDPGSKAKGGDLGFVRKGLMEKNFEQAAFSLPKGEISEPVETPFGYHLIQVTEIKLARVKPFEVVKDEIAQAIKRQKAEAKFYELGEQLAQLAYENPQSLEPAAEALGLKIQTTPPFTRDQGEGIAANSKVRATAFSAEVLEGNNSEPVELDDGTVVVLRVKEHQPAQSLPLEKVRDRIVTELKRQKARQQLAQQAKDWLARLQQGETLAQLAAQTQTKVKTASLTRSAPPAELAPVMETVFKAPKPGDRPVFVSAALPDGRQALIQVVEVQPGNYAALSPQEKKALRTNLARLFGLLTFKEYLQQLRDQTKIRIHWPQDQE